MSSQFLIHHSSLKLAILYTMDISKYYKSGPPVSTSETQLQLGWQNYTTFGVPDAFSQISFMETLVIKKPGCSSYRSYPSLVSGWLTEVGKKAHTVHVYEWDYDEQKRWSHWLDSQWARAQTCMGKCIMNPMWGKGKGNGHTSLGLPTKSGRGY